MIRVLLIAMVLLSAVGLASAQPPSERWSVEVPINGVDDAEFAEVIQLADGNLLAAGKFYDLAGLQYYAYLVKLTVDGTLLWQEQIGNGNRAFCLHRNRGSIEWRAVCVRIGVLGAGSLSAFSVFRLSATGDLIANTSLDDNGDSAETMDILFASNGNLIVAGVRDDVGYLARFDTDLTFLGDQSYPNLDYLWSVEALPTGLFVAGSAFFHPTYDAWFAHTSNTGAVQQEVFFPTDESRVVSDTHLANDSTVVVTGLLINLPSADAFVTAVAADASQIYWSTTFGDGTLNEVPTSVVGNPGDRNGYIVTGYYSLENDAVFMAEVSKSGTELWLQRFPLCGLADSNRAWSCSRIGRNRDCWADRAGGVEPIGAGDSSSGSGMMGSTLASSASDHRQLSQRRVERSITVATCSTSSKRLRAKTSGSVSCIRKA